MSTTLDEFKEWFMTQKQNGMVQFHWTLNPEVDNITSEQFMRAILDCEKLISEGKYEEIS